MFSKKVPLFVLFLLPVLVVESNSEFAGHVASTKGGKNSHRFIREKS